MSSASRRAFQVALVILLLLSIYYLLIPFNVLPASDNTPLRAAYRAVMEPVLKEWLRWSVPQMTNEYLQAGFTATEAERAAIDAKWDILLRLVAGIPGIIFLITTGIVFVIYRKLSSRQKMLSPESAAAL